MLGFGFDLLRGGGFGGKECWGEVGRGAGRGWMVGGWVRWGVRGFRVVRMEVWVVSVGGVAEGVVRRILASWGFVREGP